MACYNFFNFLKIFKYAFKGSFRLLKYLLLIPLLLFTIFLIISNSNSVSAAGFPTSLSDSDIEHLTSLIEKLDPNSQYSDFLYCNGARLILFNGYNSSTSKFYLGTGVGNTTRVFSNFSPSGAMYYQIDLANETATYWGGIETNTNMRYYDVTDTANLYASVPVYDTDQSTLLFEPNTLIPPTIENFTNQNVITSMENGEFFDIVILGMDYSFTPIMFNINNGTLTLGDVDDDIKYKYVILNTSSPYLLPYTDGSQFRGWRIPKADLIPIYDNCTYNIWLNYGENFSKTTQIFTINTSFSALGKDMATTDTQDATQDINNFLHNDNFDSNSIVSKMPSNDVPDPTADAINNIFNMFRNVFSTENAQDVVFDVPNTDESIVIPANLVTSHIPEPILILVQSFYWFLICRFIVKDISKIVEHAKSGEILDATDGNIKTDLL